MLFGLYLNADRAELRQSARVTVGVGEAFAEVMSAEMLGALFIDPIEAMVESERRQKMAERNRKESGD